MPLIMRRFCLFALILVSLSLYGQRNYYTKKADKEAIKSAYRILKAFYPDKQLCVSDSIFDLEWLGVDKETDEKAFEYRLKKKFLYDKPLRRKGLAKMLNADSCTTDENSFYADFSEPYEGMIRCDIMPLDRRVGILGVPAYDAFLFWYDKDGSITQVTKMLFQIE